MENHTVEEINTANNARARLSRTFPKVIRSNLYKISDDRLPKRPLTAFAHFIKAKLQGYNGVVSDGMKEAGTAWKGLSDLERRPYLDLMAAERTRYLKDLDSAGLPQPVVRKAAA